MLYTLQVLMPIFNSSATSNAIKLRLCLLQGSKSFVAQINQQILACQRYATSWAAPLERKISGLIFSTKLRPL